MTKYYDQLKEIYNLLYLDFWNTESFNGDEEFLFAKEKVIRGHIISTHTFLEDLINQKIINDFFGSKIIYQVKLDIFTNTIIGKIGFDKKLEIIEKLFSIPKKELIILRAMNKTRNHIAHRSIKNYETDYFIGYKNLNIMNLEGIKVYLADTNTIINFLQLL